MQTIAYIKGKCKYSSIFPLKESEDMGLEAKNLGITRADRYLFRNLNFKLSAGELLCIQGHNGSGKSTLLKVLAGLIAPDKGIVHRPEALSYLGHRDGLNMALTVEENINIQLALTDSHVDSAQIKRVMEILDISALQKRSCDKLSAGQRRKVALSIIILKGKPLWLLDEPYTSLDVKGCEAFYQCIKAHLANQGSVIMASHLPIQDELHRIINLSEEAQALS